MQDATWPGEPERPTGPQKNWMDVGFRFVDSSMKPYWLFDPKGKLRPIPLTTGISSPQLDIHYATDKVGNITGIESVRLSARGHARGWRDADELYRMEGRADKTRAFEAYKAQRTAGRNAGLPDKYLPAAVLERRKAVGLAVDSVELPPLDDEPAEPEKALEAAPELASEPEKAPEPKKTK